MCRTLYRYVDWNCPKDDTPLSLTVVPYIGTWIETKKEGEVTSLNIVVPYIGTWIETGLMRIELLGGTSRTLYRYVDWNILSRTDISGTNSRTLYRYVDWNIRTFKSIFTISTVVPYIGTWIETEINDINEHVNLRRTLYRYVDWNWNYCYGVPHAVVVPYIGTWIETRTQSDFYKVQMSYLI